MSGGEGLIWLCRALSWSHDALALIALLIVLHLGARFIMEIYGLMLGFWYFLIHSEAQVKIICFANVISVLRWQSFPSPPTPTFPPLLFPLSLPYPPHLTPPPPPPPLVADPPTCCSMDWGQGTRPPSIATVVYLWWVCPVVRHVR